ncbi:MAG TPA: hypothetical protein PKA84_01140, partial [Rubrivivax sp.]|nr:hypothetical protein [Rubrivivax sp.]
MPARRVEHGLLLRRREAGGEHDGGARAAPLRSVGRALFWIVGMNVVFSFDTVLSAIALTKNFWGMSAA